MTLMLPKVDVVFKLLFGDERSKNILADFLKVALPIWPRKNSKS
jgi:hypothetical protein